MTSGVDDGRAAEAGATEQLRSRKERHHLRIPVWLVESGAIRKMTAVDHRVLDVLALHQNWETGRCWPSNERIQKLSGCGKAQVCKAVRRLRDFIGIIEVERRGRKNIYTILRTPPPSPGIGSINADQSRPKRKRDKKGRFGSLNRNVIGSTKWNLIGSINTDPNYLNEQVLLNYKEEVAPQNAPLPIPSSHLEEIEKKIQQAKPEEVAETIAGAVSDIASKPRAKQQGLAVGEGAFKKTIEKIIAAAQVDE